MQDTGRLIRSIIEDVQPASDDDIRELLEANAISYDALLQSANRAYKQEIVAKHY